MYKSSFKAALLAAALVLASVIACDADDSEAVLHVDNYGKSTFLNASDWLWEMSLGTHNRNWGSSEQTSATIKDKVEKENKICLGGEMPIKGQPAVNFKEEAKWEEGSSYQSYDLNFTETAEFNSVQISLNLNAVFFTDAKVEIQSSAGQTTLALPSDSEMGSPRLWEGSVRSMVITKSGREPLQINLGQEAPNVIIQDNRNYGLGKFELRFIVAGAPGAKKGETRSQNITVSGLGHYKTIFVEGTYAPDMSNWFPFTLSWDRGPVVGSAVDRSWLLEAPAGKHGFLTVKDDKYVFADGTPVRFWGTNFSAAADFPTHEQAEKIAQRLASYGINMVRIHHLDAGWTNPSIFDTSYNDTQRFNVEHLDRLDYLIYCLKNQGIYIYLDQLVTRYFKPNDGVPGLDQMSLPVAKGFSYFYPRLIALQKKYSHDLWTHRNPYTELRYCDDPAFALMEIVNENDLFTTREELLKVEPYASVLKEKYNLWRQEQDLAPKELTDLYAPEAVEFLSHVQEEFYLEMMAYLREIGVRIPITGTNWSKLAQDRPSQLVCDYADMHRYWDHPATDGTFANLPMSTSFSTTFDFISFASIYGKPFFISEWDHPWPNFYRGEATLWTAAVAALQDWDGLTVYTYRHSTDPAVDYINGAFETFNDPLYYGLMPTAALLYLRSDVAPANEQYAVKFPAPEELLKMPAINIGNSVAVYQEGITERSQVRNIFGDVPVADNVKVVSYQESVFPGDSVIRKSDTGQMERNVQDGVLLIKSPGTEVAQGFIGNKAIDLPSMKLRTDNEFAVIALSSVDSNELTSADRFLLTTVSRVENTGAVYNFRKNKRVKTGAGPVLAEPVVSEVELAIGGNFDVWALDETGLRKTQVPVKDNKFIVDGSYGTIWYEIIKE